MRILHCIQSHSWGGLELYTTELIKQLAKTEHQQFVLCPQYSRVSEELTAVKNVEVVTYPQKKISRIRQAALIRNICQQKGITHLHSHTRMDMWACALAKFNSASPRHIYNLYMNAPPKKGFVHRWLFSKVDALCSSSEFVLGEARKNFPIDAKKLNLVRYGREPALYAGSPETRSNLRKGLGIKDQDLLIGTLCRIDPGKGVREIVESFEGLSDEELIGAHLLVMGDPTIISRNQQGEATYESESLALTKWIEEKMKEPRLLGHLHRIPFQKEFLPYMDALDIFVLASYNETYSLSVLDAMLMKKPVIGTDAGGTTEQIGSNERGYLAPPRDVEKMTKAFRFYVENPNEIINQGIAAQNWVSNQHRWEQTIAITLKLYQQET